MRDTKYSFNTAIQEEFIPLIRTHSHRVFEKAQSVIFYLYQGIDPRVHFKVEFVIGELGFVQRWFYHGYYLDENGGMQQTFNDFEIDPISLEVLILHISGDIEFAVNEWIDFKI
ncbi:hypothetical protein [Algoriphagus sp. Y33]|uniref:hypothetical protein n=1 Tax=Algoriphagus sp. Y33 TaxID=2772483 RepID=UPI00177C8846|nr:hypothetical protein [Algoriphagus sp. Y33]